MTGIRGLRSPTGTRSRSSLRSHKRGENRSTPAEANLPAHKLFDILIGTAARNCERREEFARTIALEAGKTLISCHQQEDRSALQVRTHFFGLVGQPDGTPGRCAAIRRI